ncbi:HdeA/HdeB family chaperone [Acetobacter ghanensis]|uniref:HdeA/HdeB family chaperone n=1 Tax=Acetobacter ghanensis TaxID=431306 RepID=UPI003D351078
MMLRSITVKTIFLLSIALLLTHPAHAETSVIGLGNFSCEKYLKLLDINPRSEEKFMAWAQGYISGLSNDLAQANPNANPNDFVSNMTYGSEKIKQFCIENPESKFSAAVDSAFHDIEKHQGAE